MKITNEIRQYILEDEYGTKYVVRRSITSDDWFYFKIEEPEDSHVNSVSWFEASDELKNRIKEVITQWNQN